MYGRLRQGFYSFLWPTVGPARSAQWNWGPNLATSFQEGQPDWPSCFEQWCLEITCQHQLLTIPGSAVS